MPVDYTRKSPRNVPKLTSCGEPRRYAPVTADVLSGVTASDTAHIARPHGNTNRNRRLGGASLYWKPRTSTAYGDAATTLPKF